MVNTTAGVASFYSGEIKQKSSRVDEPCRVAIESVYRSTETKPRGGGARRRYVTASGGRTFRDSRMD